MKYPQALEKLINKLAEFPSVGPKTAERYAFYLLQEKVQKREELAKLISELSKKITTCKSCLAISENEICPICADKSRQNQTLCIVENTQDLIAIENTKQYQGRYFVLGGLINTINEIGPQDLNIKELLKKIKAENIKELILALNFTLEGETTALYLTKLLKNHLKITRLAKGLPAGSNLEYADGLSLGNALKYRNEIK